MTSVYDLASRGLPLTANDNMSMESRLAAVSAVAPYLYTAAAIARPSSLPLAFPPGLLRPIPASSLHMPQPTTKRSTGFSIEDILNHKATKVPSPVENSPPPSSFTKLSPTELKYGFPSPFLTSPTRSYIRFADLIHRATAGNAHHHMHHPHHHHQHHHHQHPHAGLGVPIPVPVYLRGKSHNGSPLDAARAAKKCRRSRTVFSELQLIGLEKRFEKQKYLSTPDRLELAETLGLSQLQVKTWYQNRRMKWKKQVMQTGEQEAPTKPKGRPKKSEFHLDNDAAVVASSRREDCSSDGDGEMRTDDDDDDMVEERSISFSPPPVMNAHHDPSSDEEFPREFAANRQSTLPASSVYRMSPAPVVTPPSSPDRYSSHHHDHRGL